MPGIPIPLLAEQFERIPILRPPLGAPQADEPPTGALTIITPPLSAVAIDSLPTGADELQPTFGSVALAIDEILGALTDDVPLTGAREVSAAPTGAVEL